MIVNPHFGHVLSSDACTFSRLIFRERGIEQRRVDPSMVRGMMTLPAEVRSGSMNDQSHWSIYSTEKIADKCCFGKYVAAEALAAASSPLIFHIIAENLVDVLAKVALNPDFSALYSSLNHDRSNRLNHSGDSAWLANRALPHD